MLGFEFQLPALERLAVVIGDAYTGTEITDLLKKAGFETMAHDGGTKWRFLYAAFEDMQRRFGPESVLMVLKIVCNPQERLSRGDVSKEVNECMSFYAGCRCAFCTSGHVRKEVNECMSFYGLRIGEDGEARRVKKASAASGIDKGATL